MVWVRDIPATIAGAVGNIDLGFGSDEVVDRARAHANAQRAAQGMDPLPEDGAEPETRASGGPVVPGRPYMVGERGRELIFPSQAGYVATAERTQRLLDATRRIASAAPRPIAPRPPAMAASAPAAAAGPGRGGSVTINLGGIHVQGAPNMDPHDLARVVMREINDEIRRVTSSSYIGHDMLLGR
jgi:hypothetical protein